ncbi:MAG: UvrD-helicase domain-containing protein, partial [Elusimicrobiota bacterium]
MAESVSRLREGRSKPRGRILDYLDWMRERFSVCAAAVEGAPAGSCSPPPTLHAPAWPKDWSEDGQEEYKDLAKVAASLDPGAEGLFRDALGVLEPFILAARERYRAMGHITFDGLLIGARDLVRDHPSARAELKRRFSAILVDEFQDTDPVQGELLMFLGEEEGFCARRWSEVAPAPGKLFVVGDPKQSIYRFRGADIHALQSFSAHLERHGALRCALQTNFRSSPAILSAVNRVFPALLRHSPGLQAGYLPIHPRPGAEAEGEPPLWVDFAGAGDEGERSPDAEESRRAEADWIARWIAQERGSYALKDIALLLRSASPLTVYLEALRRRGILYVVEGEKRFFATQEVVDALNLLRAVDDPGDKAALAGLLRSPLSGTDDRELYRLARAGLLDYRAQGRAVPGAMAFSSRERDGAQGRAVPGAMAFSSRER